MRGSVSVRQVDGKVRLFYGAAVLGIIVLLAGCNDDGNPTDSTKIPDITHIATVGELIEFARLVNSGNDFKGKTVVLTDDIDLSGNNYDSWNNTFPIGGGENASEWVDYYDNPFDGIFDGNGKKIRGLNINNVERNGIGLFGYIGRNGEVRNLGLVDVDIIGGSSVGAVVGWGDGGKVTNCHSNGKISGRNSVGGIAGDGVTVANSYSSATVSGGYIVGGSIVGGNEVGGVVGRTGYGGVKNSYSTGAVSGNDHVGGVAGSADYGLNNCYSTGTVNGNNYVGGVAGYASDTVANCYSISAVSGNSYVGGIVGFTLDYHTIGAMGGGGRGGFVLNSAALNSSVEADSIDFPVYSDVSRNVGRVVGGHSAYSDDMFVSRNVAFSGINGIFCHINNLHFIFDSCYGPNTKNGADITAAEIHSNATIDYLFTNNSVWTLQSGKLPGLFGTAVDMPEHLK